MAPANWFPANLCQTTAVAATILASSLTGAARGEIFVLKSGGRMDAELLNPQRVGGQPYQIRTADGLTLALAENAVSRVVVKSDLQREYDAKLPSVPNTVAGHWEMAEWCKEAGLSDERRRHLQAVIGIDPDHREARAMLGYIKPKDSSRWLTQNEFLQSRGYVFHKGAWRLAQEIEIEVRNRERDAAIKKYQREIRKHLEQIDIGSRYADGARRALAEIRDPLAATALADIVADTHQPREARLACLDILGRLPPGLVTAMFVNVAMDEKDDGIRDRCLDELIRGGAAFAAPGFVRELNNKRNYKIEFNWRINRAAYCLERLGYKDATLELIDALVTEHQEVVQQQGPAPPGGTPLSFSSGGPNGGMGGLNVGGRPKVQKRTLDNAGVQAALTRLYPGTNFQYDQDAWRRWYIEKFTTTNIDFRRAE